MHPSPFLMSSGETLNQAFRVLKISFLSPWNVEAWGISIRLPNWLQTHGLSHISIFPAFFFSHPALFQSGSLVCTVGHNMHGCGWFSWRGKSNNLIIRARRFGIRPASSQGHKCFLEKDKQMSHWHEREWSDSTDTWCIFIAVAEKVWILWKVFLQLLFW